MAAGVFGISLALELQRRGHRVTVFDQYRYDETAYKLTSTEPEQAASVDSNKIFRASYGKKMEYQRLALESRSAWLALNQTSHPPLFEPCGMLRVQPSDTLSPLELETLASLARDGLGSLQFIASDPQDVQRAASQGWAAKLLGFRDAQGKALEAVLDATAGFTRCAEACAYFQRLAAAEGVVFCLGCREGCFDSLVTDGMRARGIVTRDGRKHFADTVVIAAGSSSTQILPQLSYHLESSAGSIATFKIERSNTALWNKYAPASFPVVTWKSLARTDGKDVGSIYVLPRTEDGLLKIGYRGIKFTNFQPAPQSASFSQQGMWSIPLKSQQLPAEAVDAIKTFVSMFLPEFDGVPFYSTRLCWYTDTLDNSFLIDHVPGYQDQSLFVCTGGSGHGAKFLPVLGKHAADIFENGSKSTSPMRELWRWRDDVPRRNGLDEGPDGPRNLAKRDSHLVSPGRKE
ncbi:hypothetical protein CDD81_6445 [Ophiocordyceps australis]|uniref:FAD dependent oxidoreductase domain-containing protein n=1 Tax=Ophiocordyceps australis TaxID=1399860 RepID=A0A2C5XLT5_9HYPO|nr:hypothetical protein CDD81_6445 [Ophiocordyceps australis]